MITDQPCILHKYADKLVDQGYLCPLWLSIQFHFSTLILILRQCYSITFQMLLLDLANVTTCTHIRTSCV